MGEVHTGHAALEQASDWCVPRTGFVIIGHPRSGSTLLVNALREHTHVRAYGELFQEEPEERQRGYGSHLVLYQDGMDGASFLKDRVYAAPDEVEIMAVGFKLFYAQARDPQAASAWRYLLARKQLRIVHLVRERAFDAYVSLCEANASGRWHLEFDEAPDVISPVLIDPAKCLSFLNRHFTYSSWVRQAFNKHAFLEVSFERHLVAAFDVTMRDVQTFLDVPVEPLPMLQRPQGVRPIEERVANYEAIRGLLQNTVHDLNGI
jgi:LPS sulfotransferase NodH